MKEKIKLMLLGAFIFYTITIITLIIYNGKSINKTIEFPSNEEYTETLNTYKQQLSTMEKNTCTNAISNLINYYEKTNYTTITYKEYYNQMIKEQTPTLLSQFPTIKKACNLNEQTINKYNFDFLFLTGTIQFDEILQNKYYNYELSIKDNYFRQIVEPNLIPYEYNTNRKSILIIISNLIEISKKEASNYDK